MNSKSEEGWGIQGVGRLVVAAAAPPVHGPTAGEGVVFWIGEHKGRRIGGAGRSAGDDGRAKRLQVGVSGRVERLPVLCVQRARQVHVWDGASRFQLSFGQELQRLLQ